LIYALRPGEIVDISKVSQKNCPLFRINGFSNPTSLFLASSLCSTKNCVILEGEEFTIQKVGDVEVISNPKHPIPKDGVRKRIVFEEDLSIGVVEGREENFLRIFSL
jgi:hypothetical protein